MKNIFKTLILLIGFSAFAQVNEADFPDGVGLPTGSDITTHIATDKIAVFDIDNNSNRLILIDDLLPVETVTTLTQAVNLVTYINELGASVVVDLAPYLDNTDDQKITVFSLDAITNILTITLEDGGTQTVDLSGLKSIITNTIAGNRIATIDGIDIDETITDFGTPVIDSATDPNNIVVTLPYNQEGGTVDNVVFTIPIATPVSVVDDIDLKYDVNGDLVVSITYTDDNGVTVTTTDTTPITLPANEDFVRYAGNNTVPTGTPPNGVDTTVLANGDRFDWDGTQWLLASSPCAEPMTRAQLRALRTAGGLVKDCHYTITNPSADGNLDVQEIILHAVNENTLGTQADIFTSYDATAWSGTYDIDQDDVLEVTDNLENQVISNASILNFPFGVTAVNGNTVNNRANVIYTTGNFINNVVYSDATVTTSGANVSRNHFHSLSNTTINSGDFRNNNIFSDATVSSSTTGDVDGSNFANLSSSTFSGASNFDNSDVNTDANVSMTGGTVQNSKFEQASGYIMSGGVLRETTVGQDADVTIISGDNYENVFGNSTIYRQVGTGYIRYSTIEGTTTWTNGNTNVSNVQSYISTINTTGSAGTISNSTLNRVIGTNMQNVASLTITDSTLDNYSSLTINNSARFYFYRSSLRDYGRLLISAGSRIDASYTKVSNNSYLQSNQSGGFLTVNNTTVSNSSYVRNLTPNTNTVSNSFVSGQSNMRFDGTASGCRIYYSSATSGGGIYHTGTSTNSYIYYGDASSLGQIYTQNAVNSRLYYSSADAYGYVRSLNNSATHYIYYAKASARGYVQQSNNTGLVRFYGVTAQGQSILELRNSASGNVYYASLSAYAYAYITRTGGTSSGLFANGRVTKTITNPVGLTPYASGSGWLNF